MNPSAQPWYPPGPSADGDVAAAFVSPPAVRRQNDPYQFSAVHRPPTPLCGDEDLVAIRLETLAAVPSVGSKRPYRSAALVDRAVGELHCAEGLALVSRQPPPPPPRGMLSYWPLEGGSGTLSSLESQGDSQEMQGTPADETYCNVARAASATPINNTPTTTPTCRLSIPLPRSQRATTTGILMAAVSESKPAKAVVAPLPEDIFPAIPATPVSAAATTTITTTTWRAQIHPKAVVTNKLLAAPAPLAEPMLFAAPTPLAEPVPFVVPASLGAPFPLAEPIPLVAPIVVREERASDREAAASTPTSTNSSPPPPTVAASVSSSALNAKSTSTSGATASAVGSGSPTSVAARKSKPRVRREEKWTIVQGKQGSNSGQNAKLHDSTNNNNNNNNNIANGGGISSTSSGNTTAHTRPLFFSQLTHKPKQNHLQHQRECEDAIIVEESGRQEGRGRRRVAKGNDSSGDEDELLDCLAARTRHVSHGSSDAGNGSGNGNVGPSYGNGGGGSNSSGSSSESSFTVMGVPLAAVTSGEQLLPPAPVSTRFRQALRILLRSLAMSETSSAKTLLLQRVLAGLPESSYHQCPGLVSAVLLETSDSCVDVEKSLQTCYKALQLTERHGLEVFEMLARLAITRTYARVIDIVDARGNLTRAAAIALGHREKAALGWIAMQMGVTLELSGAFPDSLAWYAAAEGLARATRQHHLLCDIQCCQSIAYAAVGEAARAQSAYTASRELLSVIPRHRHQRPLQNYAQLRSQMGDMAAALRLQEAELEIAKELGDSHAVARCIGAIALTKRFQGRYDEAAEEYMEELSAHNTHDPRQAVESLTGAAACWRMGGHVQKAHDYCMRALRQAQQCQDPTTLAKALVELAETELAADRVEEAQVRLQEALAAIARVDEAEQKQYLVKAALCEVDWRCCAALERAHVRRGAPLEALCCASRCHVPNTAHVARLLERRRRRHSHTNANTNNASAELNTASHANTTSATFKKEKAEGEREDLRNAPGNGDHVASETGLVTRGMLQQLLRCPKLKNWCIVCYSLPWSESLDFHAYVVRDSHVTSSSNSNSNNSSADIDCTARPLRLSEEVVALLCGPNALTSVFDAELRTENGERLYGDTPLWPQHYSKTSFNFQHNAEHAARVKAIASDPMYCLRVLYNAFVRPLEENIAGAAGVIFVADGVFTRLPFHAFLDGDVFLAERYCTTTCCSLALLGTLAAAEENVPPPPPPPEEEEEEEKGEKENEIKSKAEQPNTTVNMENDESQSRADNSSNSALDRRCTVIADLSADCGLLDKYLNMCGAPVQRVIVDADESDETLQANEKDFITEENKADESDAEMLAARQLLRRLHRRVTARRTRNNLYRAVHEAAGGLLDIRLRAVPEVKEDYCGMFVGASCEVVASHSGEIANTWDLQKFSLVLLTSVGTYGGMSIHETGVPVYRSLQYAAARRLLIAIGSRQPKYEAVAAAAAAAALSGNNISAAVRKEYIKGIRNGVPLAEWAGLVLSGLP